MLKINVPTSMVLLTQGDYYTTNQAHIIVGTHVLLTKQISSENNAATGRIILNLV